SNLPLLALAVALLFRATAESWGSASVPGLPPRRRPSGWATVGWSSGALYLLYRLIALATGPPDLPLGGCLMIGVVAVPLLMLVADGILLAWVLTELRNAGFDDPDGIGFDAAEPAGLMPGAALACLAALPARYFATSVFLGSILLSGGVRSDPMI